MTAQENPDRFLQKAIPGLEADIEALREDGERIELTLRNVRETDEGLVGDIEGTDEWGMSFEHEHGVPIPDAFDGDDPIEEGEHSEGWSTRKKILVGSSIGSLLTGATVVAVKYFWRQRN